MTGPRVGSRPWALTRLEPGESVVFEVPAGQGARTSSQVALDARRWGVQITTKVLLAVDPAARTVTDIVRATRT